jgi:hypothetical protein
VTPAPRAVKSGPASNGSPWGYLMVLDAGQFSTRCRCCGWRSWSSDAIVDVQTAFQTHTCSTDAVGCSAVANRRQTALESPRAGRSGLAVAHPLPAGSGVRSTSW